MLILGLTGGIACGKSTVSGMLRELGAVIVDGDELSRELTGPDGAALPAIRLAFGETVFSEDGSLNRGALGERIFSSEAERQRLDGIMQPLLRELILRRIREVEAVGAEVCVLDMPLLYEKNLDRLCHRVWCVWLPEEEQLRRLMLRNGLSRQQALERVASQLSPEEKARRADDIIDNSGTPEETGCRVRTLYRELRERSGR